MKLVDASGTVVASYEYDPYGNVISSSGDMAAINPLRYRGYYYDTEIGMYYLQSRYYDPKIGRFINADSYASTGQGIIGYNMFAYCGNNPCLYSDPFGHEGLVGFGFQVDVSTDHGTYGFEIVVYVDEDVVEKTTGNSSAKYAVVLYTYSGVSASSFEMALANQVPQMLNSLDLENFNKLTADEILITLAAVVTGMQLSGSVFAIYGYDNFESANSYSGDFYTYSGEICGTDPFLSGGAFISTSNSCIAVGIKVGVSTTPRRKLLPFDVQYSHTYYSDPYILYY